MRWTRFYFFVALVLLFLGLSFNAYACLIPLAVITDAAMGGGCSDPQDQPARQFCDAFKTLGVQQAVELDPAIDCQTFCSEDTVSLSFLFSLPNRGILAHDRHANGSPQDLLVKTAVLRI